MLPSTPYRSSFELGQSCRWGSAIENTIQAQKIAKLSVYPRADADFTLYGDNGRTSAYEEGTATSLACTGTVPTVG